MDHLLGRRQWFVHRKNSRKAVTNEQCILSVNTEPIPDLQDYLIFGENSETCGFRTSTRKIESCSAFFGKRTTRTLNTRPWRLRAIKEHTRMCGSLRAQNGSFRQNPWQSRRYITLNFLLMRCVRVSPRKDYGTVEYFIPVANTGPRGDSHHSWRECSKKSVQQGRSHFDARSVHEVREHGKMARTPLAVFFNIPTIGH